MIVLVLVGLLVALAVFAIGQDFYHRRTCKLCRFYAQRTKESHE